MDIYKELITSYKKQHQKAVQFYNTLAAIRFLLIILLVLIVYWWLSYQNNSFLLGGGLVLVGFFLVLKLHGKVRQKKQLLFEKLSLNNEELKTVTEGKLFGDSGTQWVDPNHDFTFDLDIFGQNGLYHFINRTVTFSGSNHLANLLTKIAPKNTIENRQDSVKELSKLLHFRQNYAANGRVIKDTKEQYDLLQEWINTKHQPLNKGIQLLSFALPVFLWGFIFLHWFTSENYLFSITTLFIINLFVLTFSFKKLKTHIVGTDDIDDAMKQYAKLFKIIESQNFKSSLLLKIKNDLSTDNQVASNEIHRLSRLFGQMDNLQNLVGAVIFNGLFLNHLHVYTRLTKWKISNQNNFKNWLHLMGEVDALCSLGNFHFNHPEFQFPAINESGQITFTEMGHPLIPFSQRINNDVDFTQQKLILLTGSNMSGKSTFLRTLGINMLLAGIGAPVCAQKANVQPLNILVSMRLSDSLNKNESYFFAEVKRLKYIMETLQNNTCLVLLDEILRGTNSDDKQFGTIEVVKQLTNKNAIGIVATHDLEVCETTHQFPDVLTNKCFEVEVKNDDLVFDYKLREGVCKNKSATFLMRKLGVIPQKATVN